MPRIIRIPLSEGACAHQNLYMTGRIQKNTRATAILRLLINGSTPLGSRRRRSAASLHQRGRKGELARDAGASVAVYLAGRSRRSQDARGLVDGAAACGQASDAFGAVHVQVGGRRADRGG